MTLSDLLFLLSILSICGLVYLLSKPTLERVVPKLKEELDKSEESNQIHAARSAVVRLTARGLAGRLKPASYEDLQRQIVLAGSPSGMTPETLVAGRLVTAGAFGAGLCLLVVIAGEFLALPLALIAGGIIGWVTAKLWFRSLVKTRQTRIMRNLPYELDLLTLAVEAGLDFVGGLQKVVEKGRGGPLSDELQLVLRSIRLGRTRSEALMEMAERVQVPAVRSWVRTLVQADRMGTPLGRVLRLQSERLRQRRSQDAERRANEAPVKMLFPLIFFIFPTVFLILFGPIVFRLFFVGL